MDIDQETDVNQDPQEQQEEHTMTTSPEEPWLDYVREMYPNLEQETLFFPPAFYTIPEVPEYQVQEYMDPALLVEPGDQVSHRERARNRPPLSRRERRKKKKELKKKKKREEQKKKNGEKDPSSDSSVSSEPMELTDNPDASHPDSNTPPPSPPQPEQPPPPLAEDERPLRKCLSALRDWGEQAMMVLTPLTFRKDIDPRTTNPKRLVNPLFPTAFHLSLDLGSLPVNLRDGEGDVLIIHRHHGLVVAEVLGSYTLPAESGGGGEASEKKRVQKRVLGALRQLKNQRQALEHLLNDLPVRVRITSALMMPQLSFAHLRSALNSSGELKLLCQTLSNSDSLELARSHCLCEEDLGQMSRWWSDLHPQGHDPCMTSDLYERLVARFCGPAATIEIATVDTPYKAIVKTQRQASTETRTTPIPQSPGKSSNTTQMHTTPSPQSASSDTTQTRISSQRADTTPTHTSTIPTQSPQKTFRKAPAMRPLLRRSYIALTPQQVELLSERADEKFMFIQGPPMVGKTTVLMLKALQWVRQGRKVVIISQEMTTPVCMVVEKQLLDLLLETDNKQDAEAATRVRQHLCYFGESLDIMAEVARFHRMNGLGCRVIFDHIPSEQTQNVDVWMSDIRQQDPEAWVWSTGDYARDRSIMPIGRLRPWMTHRPLKRALRAPRGVVRLTQEFLYDRWHQPYEPPALGLVPFQPLRHSRVRGHQQLRNPLDCFRCADNVALVLKRMDVGQPGGALQFRDVLILSSSAYYPPSLTFSIHLRDTYGLPIIHIAKGPLRDADAQELAFGLTNQVVETDVRMVTGLERKVVISLCPRTQSFPSRSISRCSRHLICIDLSPTGRTPSVSP